MSSISILSSIRFFWQTLAAFNGLWCLFSDSFNRSIIRHWGQDDTFRTAVTVSRQVNILIQYRLYNMIFFIHFRFTLYHQQVICKCHFCMRKRSTVICFPLLLSSCPDVTSDLLKPKGSSFNCWSHSDPPVTLTRSIKLNSLTH